MTAREINIEGEAMRTASIIDLLSASIYDKMQDDEAKPVADYLFALGGDHRGLRRAPETRLRVRRGGLRSGACR